MNQENQKLKYYLLSWYNLYKKSHEICKEEKNYQEENPIASLSHTKSLSFPSFNVGHKRKKMNNYLDSMQQIHQKLEKYVGRLEELRKEKNFSDDFNKIANITREKAQKELDNVSNKLETRKRIFALITLLSFFSFAFSGLCILILIGSLLLPIDFILDLLGNTLIIIMLCITTPFILLSAALLVIFGSFFKKYNDEVYFSNKKAELINAVKKNYKNNIAQLEKKYTNHTLPEVAPQVLTEFLNNYNALKIAYQNHTEPSSALKSYFSDFTGFDFSHIFATINETSLLYNDPQLQVKGEDLIIYCKKFDRDLEKKYEETDSSYEVGITQVSNMIIQLKDIKDTLEKEFPLPAKYQNEESITCLLSLTLDGRCDTLKEAINLLEDEIFKHQMISSLNQINMNISTQNQILIQGFNTIISQNNNINAQLSALNAISIVNLLKD